MAYYDDQGNQISVAEAASLQFAGHPVHDDTGAVITFSLSEVPIDADGGTVVTHNSGAALKRTGVAYTPPGAPLWSPGAFQPGVFSTKQQRKPLRPDSKVVTTFQSGHGWTSSIQSGSPTFNLNNTTAGEFVLGSQAIKIAAPINAQGYVSKTAMTAIDTTGKVPRIWVRVDNLATIVSATIYLGDTGFTNFYLWNIWQSGSTQWALEGEWVVITLNWSDATVTGAPNRAAVTDARVRLNAGPSGAANMYVNAIDFITQPTVFPNGVVSLTFDDGWTTQFTQAKAKMDQYTFPGTAYVIADQVSEATHTYMTLAQLQQMIAYSGWEVGSHAFTIANHNLSFVGMDASIVEREFYNIRQWCAQNGFTSGEHFAWPLGNYDAVSMALAKQYFASARSIYEKHQETLPPADHYRLRIRNVQNTTTTASLQTDIDSAFANKEWLILMFHRIETPATLATQYTPANFGTVIDYLATKGIPVRTVGDVLASIA